MNWQAFAICLRRDHDLRLWCPQLLGRRRGHRGRTAERGLSAALYFFDPARAANVKKFKTLLTLAALLIDQALLRRERNLAVTSTTPKCHLAITSSATIGSAL